MADKTERPYHKVFFAHQPIFTPNRKVWGYEVFFRKHELAFHAMLQEQDTLRATLDVLSNISLCPDLNFSPAKVIVNYSSSAILDDAPFSLHPDLGIVQLRDAIDLPRELVDKIILLKAAGYIFSIDDFRGFRNNLQFYELSDITTISVRDHDEPGIKHLLDSFTHLQTIYLAKKIESPEQFEKAERFGFGLFQGYFFKRPVMETRRKIPSGEMIRIELLKALGKKDLDFDALNRIISKDSSLSMRLIRLLNSPMYGLVKQVSSLKQALVYIGLSQLKQWLRIIVLTDLKQPHITKELLRSSLIRAKFLENIATLSQSGLDKNLLFLTGLFSLLDALLEMPMDQIIHYLAVLDEDIKSTLLGRRSGLLSWLQLAISMEESNWDRVGALAATLQLDSTDLMTSYTTALDWANKGLQNCS